MNSTEINEIIVVDKKKDIYFKDSGEVVTDNNINASSLDVYAQLGDKIYVLVSSGRILNHHWSETLIKKLGYLRGL